MQFTFSLLLFFYSANLLASECEDVYRAHIKSDLLLPYEQFDQTEKKGFRLLAESGCDKEAADLIEEYIKSSKSSKSSLRWHIAQLRATQGDYSAAIKNAMTVLIKKEDFKVDPLRWNDYVLATIAFLERDKEKLIFHRDIVAEGKEEFWGNKLNLKLLDSLILNFDKDYKFATSHIE
ncbi:hypothetical protein [Solimicrobium silvestre]|uniref:Tetratricopeptide repeat n=1 Tax=Solimicrobium silvestre TaxID=2099400 RepID=A0A2S9GTY5_9BURK|nr:hypothetical protein [Solimicrobium silvestre]PRC91170.1 hypothetical protein S2091_4171 [Solimicrobium silvestre]